MTRTFSSTHPFWGAHASRVLASASSRSRTFHDDFVGGYMLEKERLFRRDAETNTRDVCAPRNTPQS